MSTILESHYQKQQQEIKEWYNSLRRHPTQTTLSVYDLIAGLRHQHGICISDCPELRSLLSRFGVDVSPSRHNAWHDVEHDLEGIPLSFEDFYRLVGSEETNVIKRAFSGELAIPDWSEFCTNIKQIFDVVKKNDGGKNASYIPQLAEVDPSLFSVSLVTVDGQRLSLGDHTHEFTIQSCSKIFTYSIACEDLGAEEVHSHIGFEPSGKAFNAFTLDRNRKPHNPLINAGAITTCSLIRPNESATARFNYIQKKFSDFSGGSRVGFDNATFLSERDTADRNFALAYYMKENHVFPDEAKLSETLDLYFQSCSILVSSDTLAVMASTLANGGICPVTDQRIVSPQTVKNILQISYNCGMYDFSGEWAVSVGLPAKSGVAGAVTVVVPGVMGLCIFSPRLDKRGNSVRGVDFCCRANKLYKWAIFDRLFPTGKDEDEESDSGEHDVDHVAGDEVHVDHMDEQSDTESEHPSVQVPGTTNSVVESANPSPLEYVQNGGTPGVRGMITNSGIPNHRLGTSGMMDNGMMSGGTPQYPSNMSELSWGSGTDLKRKRMPATFEEHNTKKRPKYGS